MYKELKGKCKYCLGCIRLEDENFEGTNECIWAETPIEYIHRILGIEEKENDYKYTTSHYSQKE